MGFVKLVGRAGVRRRCRRGASRRGREPSLRPGTPLQSRCHPEARSHPRGPEPSLRPGTPLQSRCHPEARSHPRGREPPPRPGTVPEAGNPPSVPVPPRGPEPPPRPGTVPEAGNPPSVPVPPRGPEPPPRPGVVPEAGSRPPVPGPPLVVCGPCRRARCCPGAALRSRFPCAADRARPAGRPRPTPAPIAIRPWRLPSWQAPRIPTDQRLRSWPTRACGLRLGPGHPARPGPEPAPAARPSHPEADPIRRRRPWPSPAPPLVPYRSVLGPARLRPWS